MSTDFLQNIIARVEAEERKYGEFEMNMAYLKRTPRPLPIGSGFPFALIAELKQASPSSGMIRANYNPAELARQYEKANVTAISVLTESHFFKGALEHLKLVHDASNLPILRKDFIISPRQIHESYVNGADVVLLVVACLSDDSLKNLYELTLQFGMHPLVEVHNEHDLKRALKFTPDLIGINNRDLNTLKTDLNTSLELIKKMPSSCTVISESGISEASYIRILKDSGFSGALIGESILTQNDVKMAIESLQI